MTDHAKLLFERFENRKISMMHLQQNVKCQTKIMTKVIEYGTPLLPPGD